MSLCITYEQLPFLFASFIQDGARGEVKFPNSTLGDACLANLQHDTQDRMHGTGHRLVQHHLRLQQCQELTLDATLLLEGSAAMAAGEPSTAQHHFLPSCLCSLRLLQVGC